MSLTLCIREIPELVFIQNSKTPDEMLNNVELHQCLTQKVSEYDQEIPQSHQVYCIKPKGKIH